MFDKLLEELNRKQSIGLHSDVNGIAGLIELAMGDNEEPFELIDLPNLKGLPTLNEKETLMYADAITKHAVPGDYIEVLFLKRTANELRPMTGFYGLTTTTPKGPAPYNAAARNLFQIYDIGDRREGGKSSGTKNVPFDGILCLNIIDPKTWQSKFHEHSELHDHPTVNKYVAVQHINEELETGQKQGAPTFLLNQAKEDAIERLKEAYG